MFVDVPRRLKHVEELVELAVDDFVTGALDPAGSSCRARRSRSWRGRRPMTIASALIRSG
jgi:hypothetical protein